MKKNSFIIVVLTGVLLVAPVSAQDGTRPAEHETKIQFIDSATGFAIQPESITAEPERVGGAEKRFRKERVSKSGRAALLLEKGRNTITASSPKYQSVSGPLDVQENSPYKIKFLLDPIERPQELRPETVASLLRDDATLFQGFVGDEGSGQPLSGVRVRSVPSGVETTTDARGFFRIYIPVQSPEEKATAPAGLTWEKSGYRGLERQNVEVWPRGDTAYTIRLERGDGRKVIDQRTRHRNSSYNEKPSATKTTVSAAVPAAEQDQLLTLQSTVASNATVRVPRNIRVLEGDDTLWYVTFNYYVKNTLPSEWIRSWNTNSLNAGAVAVRGYAIDRMNGKAATSTHDICGTSDCQNFDPGDTGGNTDRATDYTDNYVMIDSSGKIANTEYSSENNSLGFPCGDGYTAPTGGCLYDSICIGKTRSGHGRGMCQYGSKRWGEGAPPRDWTWILQHYYPTLFLVKGAVLVIGDDVKARTANDCQVRACSNGEISGGINCTLITTKTAGAKGVIIAGPNWVTNDGGGFTWYKVQWSDWTVGWSCENFLDRDLPAKITITQWNFNSVPPDANTSTGNNSPTVGSGSHLLFNVTANQFNFGSSMDPAQSGTDNSSKRWNGLTSTDPNKLAGMGFAVSTVGYTNIAFSGEFWISDRSSAYWRSQYSINGTAWIDRGLINRRAGFLAGYTNFVYFSDDLTGVSGVANNANFAYRVVAEYESTATGSGAAAYVAADPAQTYNNTGLSGWDMVTVAGKVIGQPGMPASEPQLGIQNNSSVGAPNVVINWETVPGVEYEVQYTTDLSTGVWTTLTSIVAEGASSSVADLPPAGGSQRFYRLMLK